MRLYNHYVYIQLPVLLHTCLRVSPSALLMVSVLSSDPRARRFQERQGMPKQRRNTVDKGTVKDSTLYYGCNHWTNQIRMLLTLIHTSQEKNLGEVFSVTCTVQCFFVCVCAFFFVGESTSKFCVSVFFFVLLKNLNRIGSQGQHSLSYIVYMSSIPCQTLYMCHWVESHSMLLVGVVNCVHAIFSSTSETHKYKTKHTPQYLSTPCSTGDLSRVLSKNWDLPTRRNDTYKLAFIHTHS